MLLRVVTPSLGGKGGTQTHRQAGRQAEARQPGVRVGVSLCLPACLTGRELLAAVTRVGDGLGLLPMRWVGGRAVV